MPAPSNKKKLPKKSSATISTTVASQPATQTQNITASTTTTTVDFAFFIQNADIFDIAKFCNLAASTQEGTNLKLLWQRAFSEGHIIGKQEGVELGYDSGYLDGQEDDANFRKRGIDEFGEQIWKDTSIQTDSPAPLSNSGSQTEPPTPSVFNTAVQTEPNIQPYHRKLATHDATSQTAPQLDEIPAITNPSIAATSQNPTNAENATDIENDSFSPFSAEHGLFSPCTVYTLPADPSAPSDVLRIHEKTSKTSVSTPEPATLAKIAPATAKHARFSDATLPLPLPTDFEPPAPLNSPKMRNCIENSLKNAKTDTSPAVSAKLDTSTYLDSASFPHLSIVIPGHTEPFKTPKTAENQSKNRKSRSLSLPTHSNRLLLSPGTVRRLSPPSVTGFESKVHLEGMYFLEKSPEIAKKAMPPSRNDSSKPTNARCIISGCFPPSEPVWPVENSPKKPKITENHSKKSKFKSLSPPVTPNCLRSPSNTMHMSTSPFVTGFEPQGAAYGPKTINFVKKRQENAKIAMSSPEDRPLKPSLTVDMSSSSLGTTYTTPPPSFAICDPSFPSSSSNFVENHLKSPKIEPFSPPMPEISLPSPLATVCELSPPSVAIFEPPLSPNTSKSSKIIEKTPENAKITSSMLEKDLSRPANAIGVAFRDSAAFDVVPLAPNTSKNANFIKNHPESFNWSDEPCDLDLDRPCPTSKFPPRDLSVLCSGDNPWKTLQNHRGRRHRSKNQQFRPQKKFCHPYSPFASCQHQPPLPSFPDSSITLDWDHDPRLSDLSQALKALGWVRQ